MIKHLSMRVPWRDQPWPHRVCAHPRDNSSCLLLTDSNPIADAKGGPNGILLWTDDRNGVDKPAWMSMAKAVIGSSPAVGARRAAKKAVKRS
jgi:hypothetical protein